MRRRDIITHATPTSYYNYLLFTFCFLIINLITLKKRSLLFSVFVTQSCPFGYALCANPFKFFINSLCEVCLLSFNGMPGNVSLSQGRNRADVLDPRIHCCRVCVS